jgi:2-dehydropantoate 2-reductase
MKIGIVGIGGVGGVLAALLARGGEPGVPGASGDVGEPQVALLARGAHGEALRSRGLRLQGTLGDFVTTRFTVSARGAELGPCDVVFVAVKTFQLAGCLPELRALVGAHTLVIPLLNGVSAAERLAAELGEPQVLDGIAYVNSWVASPGVVGQLGPTARLVVGEREARRPSGSSAGASSDVSARLADLRDVLQRAGLGCEVVADVVPRSWEKFLGFEPMALVGALSRSSIGVFRAEPGTRALLRALMHEVAQIARARGVALGADALERRLALIDGLAPDATISLQRDLMSGRPSELMEQSVELVERARALGVATPAHDHCVPLVLLQERAARARAGFAEAR